MEEINARFMRNILKYIVLVLIILGIEFTSFFSPVDKSFAYLAHLSHPFVQQVPSSNDTEQRQIDYARLKSLEQENADLKEQLQYTTRTRTIPVVAQRIGVSTDPLKAEIIIDRGSKDGVAVGDPVIAGDGLLVGTVQSLDRNSCAVLPLTDPRSKILATILQEKNIIDGIAEGQFNVGLIMTLIPINDELKKDDLVVTSGRQDKIPQGLVIGTIQDIRKHPEDLFQSAVLRTARQLDELTLVSVLIQKQASE